MAQKIEPELFRKLRKEGYEGKELLKVARQGQAVIPPETVKGSETVKAKRGRPKK